MLSLPDGYGTLIAARGGEEMFGIVIDDSPILRDLVRLAWEITCTAENPSEAVQRIKLLVLGNLAATFTFNNEGLETGGTFPASLPLMEQERWEVCMRDSESEVLDLLAPARYSGVNIRLLSVQIGARIGDCAVYTLVLGILLYSCDLCTKLTLVGNPPHAWVYCLIRGEKEHCHVDLSAWSHGWLEKDKLESYVAWLEEAPHKIVLLD